MIRTAGGTRRGVGWLAATGLTVLGLVACGTSSTGGGGSSAATPGGGGTAGTMLVIQNFSFSPTNLVVAPGSTIMIENKDRVTHTMTSDAPAFDSGNIGGGQTGRVTAPTTPGNYPFHCTPHAYMKATLTVR